MKKFVATVNLVAIIASSCMPVWADMRQEKLNEREKLLTERALTLSDKEINLEDKEQELNRRNAELEELARTINSRNIEFTVREIELDDLRAQFNRDNALLADQNRQFMRDQEEFAQYKAEVRRQAADATKAAREANERLRLAEEREIRNEQREKELTSREDKITEDLGKIQMEKAELLMLVDKSDEVKQQLAALEKREQELAAAREIFVNEKKKLADDEAALTQLREDATKAMAEARALMAAATEKTEKANAIIEVNEYQKKVIAELQAALDKKNEELKALMNTPNGPLYALLPTDIGPNVPANNSVTVTDKGLMNWSDGSIRARGMGIAPADKTEEQGRLLARRAAILDLQRNLLETIQGVQIDAHTKMVDFMASDTVTSAVNGTIKGVEVISEEWDPKEKIYTVAGQVKQAQLTKAMSEISKKIRLVKLPREPRRKSGQYTGLILDARHLPIEQQKFFHIVDERGQPVYGIEYTDRNTQNSEGLCAYYNRMVYKQDEERVGDNPMVIKAQRLANNNTDIVITNAEADLIRKNAVNFRKDCKVIVVKS